MMARALTIAGSDPSGGAGIQQDLKTFEAHDVWGMTAITALTVQDTAGVRAWHRVEPEVVVAQIHAVASDIGVDAAKTGMLPDAALIHAVCGALADANIDRLVVDPVLAASSGDALTSDDAIFALRELLLPRALVVTPNADEAFRLTGIEVRAGADQVEAARALRALGARAAIVTGGHVVADKAIDILVDEHGVTHELVSARVQTPHSHGTGCMFSAALCAGLAKGLDVETAAREAKGFVQGALEGAVALGARGSVNARWRAGQTWPYAGHPFE